MFAGSHRMAGRGPRSGGHWDSHVMLCASMPRICAKYAPDPDKRRPNAGAPWGRQMFQRPGNLARAFPGGSGREKLQIIFRRMLALDFACFQLEIHLARFKASVRGGIPAHPKTLKFDFARSSKLILHVSSSKLILHVSRRLRAGGSPRTPKRSNSISLDARN